MRSVVEARRGLPAWVLLVQLFIGVGWLRAGIEKIVDPLWWNGTVLREFIADQAAATLPWYQGFLEAIVAPNLLPISVVVVVAQLFAGACLVSGRFVVPGALLGIFLNLNFVAAGVVNPSIFYVVCQAALMLWVLQARTASGASVQAIRWIWTGSVFLFVINVPFMRHFSPEGAIDDPAMVLAFFGVVMAASIWLSTSGPASQGDFEFEGTAGSTSAW